MEPTERENSSTYQSRQASSEPQFERPSPPPRQPEPAKKKSKAAGVLAALLVLALAGAGVLGWITYDQSNQVSTLANQVESKDGQISRLTSQLTEVKKDAQRVKSDEVTTDTANQGSDAIIKAALKYSRAKVANRGYPAGATDLTAEIDKQTAQFARVQVGSATAGPGLDIVYFKKDGADWMLLGGDNGDPTRFRQTFGMPSDF